MLGLSLCSGVGGLELGLKLALGDAYRCVGYVERDAYAAAALVARMEDEALDRAPIWDDLESFDGAAWRGCVDLVSAGFPCQPFSQAGKQLGKEDDRWLWPLVERIIRDVEPRYVVLENVPGIVRHGLDAVAGGLADLGFDAEWDLFSAAGVGAPHKRLRFFLVAHYVGNGVGWDTGTAFGPKVRDAVGCEKDDHRARRVREGMGDADSSRYTGRKDDSQREPIERITPEGTGQSMGDAECDRRQKWRELWRHETEVTSQGRSPIFLWPPGPNDTAGWREYIASGGPEPAVLRGADGPSRSLDLLLSEVMHETELGQEGSATRDLRELLRDVRFEKRTTAPSPRHFGSVERGDSVPAMPRGRACSGWDVGAWQEAAEEVRCLLEIVRLPAQPEQDVLSGVLVGAWANECKKALGSHSCSRVDRLRCVGNGVVPLVAARAVCELGRRLGLEELT